MNKIMRREVTGYQVSVFQGSRLNYCRVLRLKLAHVGGEEAHEAVIKFAVVEGVKDLRVETGRSEMVMPLEDYEHMYHVLQTERPVYFTAFDEKGSLFCGVSTDDEPVGEGLYDAG